MRSPTRWGWAVILMALALTRGQGALARDQVLDNTLQGSGCTVSGERSFTFLETKPVQWGGEVDVQLTLTLDCPAGTHPSQLTLTEHLTSEVQYEQGVGTPPASVLGDTVSWTVEDPPPRNEAVEITYRAFVVPDPDRFTQDRTLLIDMAMDIDLTVQGRTEHLVAPQSDPLTVTERPGARDCRRILHEHSVWPQDVDPGEPFDITLRLTFEACRVDSQRQRAMVVVQPVTSYAERQAMIGALGELLRAIDAQQPGVRGMAGLVANTVQPSVMHEPTVDRQRIESLLVADSFGSPTAADAATGLRRALRSLTDWPFHHEVIYLVTHSGAPPAGEAEMRAALDEAASQGVEVATICVGGECDPALSPDHELANWQDLALGARAIPRQHRGPRTQLEGIEIEEAIPSYVTLHQGSAMPASAEVSGRRIVWRNLTVPIEKTLEVSYQAHADDWGRLPIGSGSTARYERIDGRDLEDMLLLPAFVTVHPHSGLDGCRSVVAKTARPSRVPVGEPVDVRLQLRADCGQLNEHMNVVLSMDRSGSMTHGGTEYSYVKLAARTLAEMLAVSVDDQRRFGLISHGAVPVVEVPLSNDLDDIAARIDAMVGKGQDSVPQSIDMAASMLRAARPPNGRRPIEIVVVMSDGGQNYPPADVIAAAERAKADGIIIVSACSLTDNSNCDVMSEIATDRQHYVEVDRVHELLDVFVTLAMQLREVPLEHVTITDDLAPNMLLVPGSVEPAPARIEGRRITWEIDDVAIVGAQPSYRARPMLLGVQPVNSWADVSFRDAAGRSGYRVFPVPEVETYLPEPRGPCEVVLDKIAAPTSVRVGDDISVSMQMRATCPKLEAPVEAVLAIDHSDSMRGPRLENAKAAALAFVDGLDPGRDRVGLVPFSTVVDQTVPLTSDFRDVRDGIVRIEPHGTTAIGAALRAAHELMGARRTSAKALVVLLTDGRDPQPWIMLEQARVMKEAGIAIATFCAGDCDPELARVASSPELAVTVNDSEKLVELYRQLAEDFAGGYAHDVVVSERLSPVLSKVAGSEQPAADEIDSPDGDLVWRLSRLPAEGFTVTHTVRASMAGPVPIGRARLDYLYGKGTILSGRVYFPVPVVEVVGGASPTPLPPLTSTPLPTDVPTRTPTAEATATATASATPGGRLFSLHIPVAWRSGR